MVPLLDPSWTSPERLASYQDAAGGDPELAAELYEWNALACGALFEVVHHFEVLLRNAIVQALEASGPPPRLPPGSPWIQGARQIDEVVGRLRRQGKEASAARVYAALSFGFWQTMFSGATGEELWRHALQYAFRHSRADRAVIADYLESINQLRNRIAHHGSLIELDIVVELQKLLRLAGWIDPGAAEWLQSIERVVVVAANRPIAPPRNVVVVPAADAWPLYEQAKRFAYVFPAARSIKVVDRLAFYADKQIKPIVPVIRRRFDAVDWNKGNAKRLAKSSDADEQQLAAVISAAMARGWKESVYQVFLLSAPDDAGTERLTRAIEHSAQGRGSAFAQGHRYVALSKLKSALDTAEIY